MKFHFLNHSSLLIQAGNSFIYTDPFYSSPAFETWLPCPPMAVHPAYLLAISHSVPDFYILVSHGHDDHCDDRLIALFKHCRALVTKFDSPGVLNRLTRLGFQNIHLLEEAPAQFGDLAISAFVDRQFSLDDSVQLISSSDMSFVHANDCWWPLSKGVKQGLLKSLRRPTLYASQIAVADGYPMAYENYSPEEKEVLFYKRVDKHIDCALQNAIDLGASHFLHYAGHVKIFSDSDSVNARSGFISNLRLKQRLEGLPGARTLSLLDCVPGDSFIANEVIKGIGREYYGEEEIKRATSEFWSVYGEFRFKSNHNQLTDKQRHGLLKTFSNQFKLYVESSITTKNFREEILSAKVIFSIEGSHSEAIEFFKFEQSDRIDLEVIWTPDIADQILTGRINFESSYIGCLGRFRVNPADLYNGHVVRWLTMFGYVWQNRLLNELRKNFS